MDDGCFSVFEGGVRVIKTKLPVSRYITSGKIDDEETFLEFYHFEKKKKID